ncbi:MAG: PHP domain-containing protein [Clostridia bacterium]|nr:PHP domain-containing protein [Clostridia bacterium]
MKLLSDYHTHSKYSRWLHGKNTIEEIAIEANEAGLEEVAITDHGFKHLFRTNKENIKKARKEIDEINKWSKTKVLLGLEADIISENGDLDVDPETMAMLDILIIGYHRMIKTNFAGFFGAQPKTPEAREKVTRAFVNAINKNPVSIVAHVNSILNADLYEIGVACREKDVLVEINNRHTNWTEDEVNDLVASGCAFVVDSDAHKRADVGVADHAFELIKKYNIPHEYIANVEFSEDEQDEDEKEINSYFKIRKEKEAELEDKKIALQKKEETEFTEKLSDEMEEALEKIAHERGYVNYERAHRQTVNDDIKIQVAPDEEYEKLVEEAQEYLRDNGVSLNDTIEDVENTETFDSNLNDTPKQDASAQVQDEISHEDAIINLVKSAPKKEIKAEESVEIKTAETKTTKSKAQTKFNPLGILNDDDK